MACHPPPSTFKKQAAVLRQLKVFNRGVLNHVQAIRATNAVGCTSMEPWEPLEAPQRSEEEEAALRAALSALRLRSKQASLPCRITPGVFIGGAAAARNLKGLRKRGITHILNAAPAVPCHFKDNPEGCFTYLALPLFDDPEADLLAHLEASNAFIAGALQRGGAVLVHCYAGQSRSAALVIAHLITSQGLCLMDAWALTRRGRPCAQPNSGFLRQLSAYAKLHADSGEATPGSSPPSDCEEYQLVLTQ